MHALFGYFHKFLEMTDVQYKVITDAANLEVCSEWCCKLSANVCLVFPALDVSFVNTYYNMYIVNNAGRIPWVTMLT